MSPRQPTAFDLDGPDVAVIRAGERAPAHAATVVEDAAETLDPPPVVVPEPRGFPWGRLFWSALGGLVSLGVGLWLDGLVRDLFARNDALGWLALGLVGLALLGVLGLVVREGASLARLARIDRLRHRAEAAALADDRKEAGRVVDDLLALYAGRPDLATALRTTRGHEGHVIDGRDLLVLAEADILADLDLRATRLVSDACKRVSVVTAVSPRAAVDVIFVVVAALGLIRRLGVLYGGRPGLLGFARLTRLVITHLAVTGSIAIGDSLVQQLVGHGLAAKLSARLGEGVVNGLLTARVGIAAIDVCRPLPFLDRARPGVSEVMARVAG